MDRPRERVEQGEGEKRYRLTVPIDASGVEDLQGGQSVKVAVRDDQGAIHSAVTEVDEKGQGSVSIGIPARPGRLQVMVGPGDATDEEIAGLQTLQFSISSRQWRGETELRLNPVIISAAYWYWWLRWCRRYVIRGRVLCPDGSPVPGATVCAYDVDWWFFWSSTQQVGCATTDITGSFEISFRWCCGWWPWWWWRSRVWQLDPVLSSRVTDLLQRNPGVQLGPASGHQPSLNIFEPMLQRGGVSSVEQLIRTDVGALDRVREELVQRLPIAPELQQLHVWPWWPWWPWWDCSPDIIFKVTQDCVEKGAVIVNEGVFDTRWNVTSPLNVTLIANDRACCRPLCHGEPCVDGECLIIDKVCSAPAGEIGGNLGAPATPAGYLNPGPVPVDSTDSHRPFAGIVPIYKNPGDLLGVDYLEFEHSADGGATWSLLPGGAGVDFDRQYWDTATSPPPVNTAFKFDSVSFPGHTVLETREHRETVIGGSWDVPGADHFWLSPNWNLLLPLDSTKLADGTYHFRAIGWDDGGGGTLVNRRVLPFCGSEKENDLVLTFDNRIVPQPGHDPTHLCGGVHLCTVEPDTHILAVRVNGTPVGPCDTVDATSGTLEIDFEVVDVPTPGQPAHLGSYTLYSLWGLNQSRNLLQFATSVTVLSGGPTGWAAGQTSGNYGTAVSQGAVAPSWGGGRFRLTMPLADAFPVPCCYQLDLWAHKRTIVGGSAGLEFACNQGHSNETQYTLGVGVCGTPPVVGAVEGAGLANDGR